MELRLIRQDFSEKSTIGVLSINGVFECYTLEDVVREKKIPHETAIPTGTYDIILDYSNRFKKIMPHILDVLDFLGIRIHPGNTDVDTDGCILVGTVKGKDKVLNSRIAFDTLFAKLEKAFAAGEKITIKIS